MKTFVQRIRAIVTRPRVQHYIEIFGAACGSALFYDRDRLLGAHGLDVIGCLVFGASVAGVKAVLEAYRKGFSLPAPAKTGK